MRLVAIDYTNYRGERKWRIIDPIMTVGGAHLMYRETEYHQERQWILTARDLEKPGEMREFAMVDIHDWIPLDKALAIPEVLAIAEKMRDHELMKRIVIPLTPS